MVEKGKEMLRSTKEDKDVAEAIEDTILTKLGTSLDAMNETLGFHFLGGQTKPLTRRYAPLPIRKNYYPPHTSYYQYRPPQMPKMPPPYIPLPYIPLPYIPPPYILPPQPPPHHYRPPPMPRIPPMPRMR